MKTLVSITLSTLAVVAAFLVMIANTGAGGLAFTALGVLAMLYADYGRKVEPMRARASVISMDAAGANPREEREAA